jgi:antitoxin component YwqK of YwqJK toxin-antitoxin module
MNSLGGPATRLIASMAAVAVLLGLLVSLAACQAPSPPQLTGHQGGLLPGMVLPESPKPKPAPLGYTGTIDQVLPDGHVLRREIYNGMVISQTWLTSLGRPERQVFYQGGSSPIAETDFGPDGQPIQQITFFPGSNQPMRIEEYADGNRVTRFTEYWSNGRPRIFSEADVSTPAGVVNRIQSWYENGRPKSLVQKTIERDETGRAVGESLQGRQTEWNEDGVVVADAEYDHDTLKHDYLVEAKKYAP